MCRQDRVEHIETEFATHDVNKNRTSSFLVVLIMLALPVSTSVVETGVSVMNHTAN